MARPETISIAMATYNGERFLEEQLDSLAAQTFLPIELQVGDDGSTDGTLEIVRRFASSAPFKVELVRNRERLGFGENFVQTALRCSGDWIAFCDQDDVWLAHKLSWATKQISNGPADLMLLAHNATVADDGLRSSRFLANYPTFDIAERLELPPEWYCLGLTQVFRADLLKQIPCEHRVSFPWHSHRDAHDVWVALIANALGSILRSDESLALYRRHGATATVTGAPARWPDALRNFGANYGERAAYLNDVAKVLEACASASKEELRARLQSAADKIRVQAQFLTIRSEIYRGNRGHRLRSLALLVRDGGYFGGKGWPFGARHLVKDLLIGVGTTN